MCMFEHACSGYSHWHSTCTHNVNPMHLCPIKLQTELAEEEKIHEEAMAELAKPLETTPTEQDKEPDYFAKVECLQQQVRSKVNVWLCSNMQCCICRLRTRNLLLLE